MQARPFDAGACVALSTSAGIEKVGDRTRRAAIPAIASFQYRVFDMHHNLITSTVSGSEQPESRFRVCCGTRAESVLSLCQVSKVSQSNTETHSTVVALRRPASQREHVCHLGLDVRCLHAPFR